MVMTVEAPSDPLVTSDVSALRAAVRGVVGVHPADVFRHCNHVTLPAAGERR